ncbi:heavy metal-binding protein HIP-like [Mytilus galloprovincialis]|uniref:heavy metal-binding protein HIP-like n=1 Tax=Mytilus galloprovincialis TaxID=29158 RepID=UPI003F7B61DD
MKNIFISMLFITCIIFASVYGGQDCSRKIGKAKAALSEAIHTLQNTKKEFLGETGSPIPSSKVAFHARLTNSITLGSTQTVIFDHVITNIGKAYNQHTGHFTAPSNGIYFFACTFLQYGVRLHLQMVQNSSEISKGYAQRGDAASGSMSAVIYLNKGDVVKVRHYPGQESQTIHGDWSYFMGYLL